MERRDFIKLGAVTPVFSYCTPEKKSSYNNSFQHSICRWCYSNTPLEELADHALDLGIHSIELLDPDEWDTVLSRGLQCAVSNGSPLGITEGFNNPDNHSRLLNDYKNIIPAAAEKGIPNIICFSGNANGLPDDKGL
ncbi:MAG: hypothetical protein KJO50_06675, partial [Bacteroidia bacterium]|nr:hypothetical protein [Bacteroidia bacterium]